MLLKIKWIKEINGENVNIDFLVDWFDDSSQLKSFFNKLWIIVFSSEKVDKFYWYLFYVIVKIWDKKIKIYSNSDDIDSLCLLFLRFWFEIVQLNTVDEKYTLEQINSIIKKSVETIKNEVLKWEEKKISERKVEIKSKIKEQNYIHNILSDLIKQSEFYISELWDDIDYKVKFELNKKISIMKKFLMSKNINKVKWTIYDVIVILEDVKKTYYEKIIDTWMLEGFSVSSVDIIREFERFKTSQIIQKLKLKPYSYQNFYIFFQKIWVFLVLIFKDIKNKFLQFSFFKKTIYKFIDLFFLYSLVFFGLALFFIKILWLEKIDPYKIYLYLLFISVLSLSSFIWKKISDRFWYVFLSFIIWIVVNYMFVFIFSLV